MHTLSSPLRVYQTKKKDFILNLNVYRNSHYRTLNTVKIRYKEVMKEQILKLPKMEKIILHYRLYPKSRRLTDLDNVISVHSKFFQDALVELGIIPDDDYRYIIGSTQEFGEVDKDNPRVEIKIKVIK